MKKGRKAATAKAAAKVAVKINNIVLLVSERISLSMRMRSVFLSSDALNSSSSIMLPGRSKPRATAMRCAWPSLRPSPHSPQRASNFNGRSLTKSAAAVCSASHICSSVASALPRSRLLRMVPLSRLLPWGTYTKFPRNSGAIGTRSVLLYKKISPAVGCSRESISLIKVLFPAPVSPTIAVRLPGLKS